MSQDLGNKLHLLLQSEKALLKLEAARRGRQVVMSAIAVIAVLAALIMLNVAIFLYLETLYTPQLSALLLAGLNMLLALLFFWISSRQTAGAQAESLQEIRDFAVKQLAEDVDDVKSNVVELKNGIQSISSGVHGVLNRDFLALKSLIPLLQMLLDRRKSSKEKS